MKFDFPGKGLHTGSFTAERLECLIQAHHENYLDWAAKLDSERPSSYVVSGMLECVKIMEHYQQLLNLMPWKDES